MFHDIIASSTGGEPILVLIEYAALAIEILAVMIIIVAIIHAVLRYTFRTLLDSQGEDPYQELKVHLGKALLLGLEILVAADIIRTVALEATLESVLILGLLVLIRTFLSWALVVEIEGRWPWNPAKDEGNSQREEAQM
ncbi:MAG: DUF1622 domain-containing protein [Anaerolineales bacterium]|nr:DUF1622 domain-containing protein [Anaerolineales bacterium]